MVRLTEISFPLKDIIVFVDFEAIDLVLDMKIDNTNDILKEYHDKGTPGIIACGGRGGNFVGLLFFMPPEGLQTREDQLYLLMIGNSLDHLIGYIARWRDREYRINMPLHGYLSEVIKFLVNLRYNYKPSPKVIYGEL